MISYYIGMVGHRDEEGRYLPLLPRGDPAKPRPAPRFSVADMPAEDVHKKRGVKQEAEKGVLLHTVKKHIT